MKEKISTMRATVNGLTDLDISSLLSEYASIEVSLYALKNEEYSTVYKAMDLLENRQNEIIVTVLEACGLSDDDDLADWVCE